LRYDGGVIRVLHAAAAAAVAVVLAVVPLVSDWCALSCDQARATMARGVPACHHATTARARVGRPAAPCGHEHHPVVVDAAAAAGVGSRAAAPIAVARTVVESRPPALAGEPTARRRCAALPSLSTPLAVPLRI
jgi:hypothetical protein